MDVCPPHHPRCHSHPHLLLYSHPIPNPIPIPIPIPSPSISFSIPIPIPTPPQGPSAACHSEQDCVSGAMDASHHGEPRRHRALPLLGQDPMLSACPLPCRCEDGALCARGQWEEL